MQEKGIKKTDIKNVSLFLHVYIFKFYAGLFVANEFAS